MNQSSAPGIPLFRLFGIQVSLHWMWLLVALYEIQTGHRRYSSIGWSIAEYLSLFAIVLLHEFGHALACRSVGGRADRIMLWPLGGVAFVAPPQRPGPVLWSIAAGPLVNVILIPVTIAAAVALESAGAANPDLRHFVRVIGIINVGLLIFNMLPIYPLDGGQILRAILWFFIGPARSLLVASIIGLGGSVAGIGLALWFQDVWLILIAAFAAMQSWGAYQQSRGMSQLASTPPRSGVRCPHCGTPPPAGPVWTCQCGQSFDPFETSARCPRCGGIFLSIPCPACGQLFPSAMWSSSTPAPVAPGRAG